MKVRDDNMTIIDAWGNEFYSKKDAETFWTNKIWGMMDADFVSDHFNLDFEIANWIVSKQTRWEDFKQDFKGIFDMIIKDYISDYYDESEIIDDE